MPFGSVVSLASLILVVGGAFFVIRLIFKAGKRSVIIADFKEVRDDQDEQNEKDIEFKRRRNDPDRGQRVLDAINKARRNGGVQD